MKHFTMVLALGLLVGGCGVEGNGDIISESRSVGEFEGVQLSVDIDTNLEVADFYEVSITCDSNLVHRIDTSVSSGTLEIDTSRLIDAGSDCFVTVQAPYFDHIVVNGSGDLQYDAAAPVEILNARVNGSGGIAIGGIESDKVNSRVAGSGEIVLSGSSRTLEAKIEGSGDIWARGLLAETAKADTYGSGDIELFASKEIDASTHASGDISVYGDPEIVDVSTDGSGRVRFK
jgi:hypothetical protein